MRVRPGVEDSELADLAARLRELTKAVCGPGFCTVGANVTEEPLSQGFEFGFILGFADRGTLDAYLVHPAHLSISLVIRDLAETVLVFDLSS